SQDIAFANASVVTWPVWFDSICNEMPSALEPPDSVVGDLKFLLLLEIDPGERAGCDSHQEQQAGGKPQLEVLVHRSSRGHEGNDAGRLRIAPCSHEQLRCHGRIPCTKH